MKKNWFEDKKDIFIKEMVCEYLKTKIFFDSLNTHYKDKGKIEFEKMASWVGTELKKGPLWNLKDLCHSLFRDRNTETEISEILFDWTLGSVFHECMKLKEDIYQLEAYWPRYAKTEKKKSLRAEIKKLSQEYEPIAKRTERDMKHEMDKIQYLFSKANEQLLKLVPKYSENRILIRFLIDSEESLDNVFGKNSLKKIFDLMFQGRFDEPYCLAGENLLEGGWYERAIHLFEEALKRNPQSTKAKNNLLVAKRMDEKRNKPFIDTKTST